MSAHTTILLVDDDPDLRDALAEQLISVADFTVREAETAIQGVELAQGAEVSLILLDVDLPDLDGREACKMMRAKGVKSPIIMLTGQTSEADTVLGLDAGANDYVAKPFKLPVLLARIRAQLRQFQGSDDATFQLGPYAFTPATKMLTQADGRKIKLTEKETSILKFMLRAQQHAVKRETLLGEVWGYNSAVTTHTLETHIYRLRQKIERNPATPRLLLTEFGGYKLNIFET